MPTMGRYCKAYPIQRFEAYPGWPPQPAAPDGAAPDRPYYFLQEDYTVTRDTFLEDVVFGDVSDAWRRFCRETLEFTPPSEHPEPAQPAAAKA